MIQPKYELIVVQPTSPPESSSSLILPENLQDNKRFGVLISKGEEVGPYLNINDKVLWCEETGEVFTDNGVDYIIMNSRKIQGVLCDQ